MSEGISELQVLGPVGTNPPFGASRAICVLLVYVLVQIGVSLIVALPAKFVADAYVSANGISGTQAVVFVQRAVLFPTILIGLLASGIVAYRMVRHSFPGRLATGALSPIGWSTCTSNAWLLGVLVGLILAFLYLRVAIAMWPPGLQQELGPMATAISNSIGWEWGVWAVIAVLVAPPVEEFLFRGALLAGLARSVGVLPAGFIVTSVFVLAHLTETRLYYPALASVTLVALAALVLRLHTQSLIPAIALHAGYNFAVVVAAYTPAA